MDTGASESGYLKPCPFCEEDTDLGVLIECGNFADPMSTPVYLAHCRKCDATGPGFNTKGGAVDAWNKVPRVSVQGQIALYLHKERENDLIAEIELLQDKIEQMNEMFKVVMETMVETEDGEKEEELQVGDAVKTLWNHDDATASLGTIVSHLQNGYLSVRMPNNEIVIRHKSEVRKAKITGKNPDLMASGRKPFEELQIGDRVQFQVEHIDRYINGVICGINLTTGIIKIRWFDKRIMDAAVVERDYGQIRV